MQGVVDNINNRDVDIDIAVFLGTNHIKLIKILNNQTNIFKLPYTTLITKCSVSSTSARAARTCDVTSEARPRRARRLTFSAQV